MGTPVAAIGSPFGERQSLSVGVISALDRTIESLTQFPIGNAIQTDAAINPGNSGGPLLNGQRARCSGSTRRSSPPAAAARGSASRSPWTPCAARCEGLREDGKVDYGYLGVTSQPLYPQLAERLDLPTSTGALIVQVQGGSPADKAGLETGGDKIEFQGQPDIPADGDVVLAVDGDKLTREADLADLISAKDAGDEVELEVYRDGDRRTVKVKLGSRPERPPQQP